MKHQTSNIKMNVEFDENRCDGDLARERFWHIANSERSHHHIGQHDNDNHIGQQWQTIISTHAHWQDTHSLPHENNIQWLQSMSNSRQ
jgi:hypothetical protein